MIPPPRSVLKQSTWSDLTSHLTDTGWSPAGADLAETGFKSYFIRLG
jgi:hypothetical protein